MQIKYWQGMGEAKRRYREGERGVVWGLEDFEVGICPIGTTNFDLVDGDKSGRVGKAVSEAFIKQITLDLA